MFFNQLPVAARLGTVFASNSGIPREWIVEREMRRGRSLEEYLAEAPLGEIMDLLFCEPTNSEHSELKGPLGTFGYNAFKLFSKWSGCERMVRGNVRERSGFLVHFSFPTVPPDGREVVFSISSTGRKSPTAAPLQVETPVVLLIEGGRPYAREVPL